MNAFKIIRNNLIFIFLAIALLSSAIVPIENGKMLYVIGFSFLFFVALYLNRGHFQKDYKYAFFYLACILSSIGNMVFDIRLILFGIMLFVCTPITNSIQLLKFRNKFIFAFLIIFPLLTIINIYCFTNGINYYRMDEDLDFELNFSGLFPHPMWLAAATGISNQVFLWLFFTYKKKQNKLINLLLILGFLSSLYLTFIAASRTAVIASIISSIVMIFLYAEKTKTFFKYVSFATIILILTSPIYYKASTRILLKFEYSEGQYGSRTSLFEEGFEHFNDSPIFGVGFATKYINNEKVVGRIESGSGWLSILFQMGLLGAISILYIILGTIKTFKISRKSKDKKLILYESVFVFLCAHSCFEGYILTPGYYPCILFWTILGYLTAYPKFIEGGYETKHKVLERFEFEQRLLEIRKAKKSNSQL